MICRLIICIPFWEISKLFIPPELYFGPLSKVYDERVRQCRVPGKLQSNITL